MFHKLLLFYIPFISADVTSIFGVEHHFITFIWNFGKIKLILLEETSFVNMTVILNNEPVSLPDERISLHGLLELRNIPLQGTAVALNDKLVRRTEWENVSLKEKDNIVVISAAFGG